VAINEGYELRELEHDEDEMDRHGGLEHEGEYMPEYKIAEELAYEPDYNAEINDGVCAPHTTSNTLFSTPSTFLSTPTSLRDRAPYVRH
jgi:hypothetical protein